MARPAPSPKYRLQGPRPEKVVMTLYTKEPGEPLTPTTVEEVRDCYRLYMPSGPNGEFNSIRITSQEQLVELGLDPNNTPLIDPETGETVGSFSHRVSQDYGPEPVMPAVKKKEAA